VHCVDTARDDAGTTEMLETQYRSDAPFERAVVLLNEVVQVFFLADFDGEGLREKLGVGAAAHEHHQAALARVVECVDQ
jgi:hypothetical protein